MKKVLFTLLVLSAILSVAQKKEDIEAIMDMCGCYEISFNFAETFAAQEDYTFHDNYRAGGLEWIFPVAKSDDKIVLQHLLIVNDSMIVKHWRQDWLYENQDLFVYNKDNSWTYKKLPAGQVDGQWTQKVFQVDDSPRYEGNATWVHVDGKHFWESTADAPLPRREFSKRDDYNVMIRKNRHEITDFGWVHEQDNEKVIRSNKDELIAKEKGYNTYTQVDKSNCQPAIDWWETNKNYWADVRDAWDRVFAQNKNLSINMKVEDKIMFQRFFELGNKLSAENYDQQAARKGIREILKKHITSDIKIAVN